MDAALAIPELLEAILLQLDTRTLLVSAQRVDTRWCSLIRSSPRLQESLFFQSAQHVPRTTPIHNSILIDTFPFCFEQLRQAPINALPTTSRSKDTSTLKAVAFPESAHITNNADAFSRPEASWRRMLIQHPPLRSHGVVMTAVVSSVMSRNTDGDPLMGDGHEILLMPSPSLAAGNGHEILSMPYLLEKCLTGPQKPAGRSDIAAVSGFRVIWTYSKTAAEATWSMKQVVDSVREQAAVHGMVLNPVIGLAKMGPVDRNAEDVRNILLGCKDSSRQTNNTNKPPGQQSDITSDIEI